MANAVGIDTKKEWFFQFGSLVENKVPVTMEEKGNAVSFFVPIDEKKGISIELSSLNKETQAIEGKYTLSESGYNSKVSFKIVKEGRLFQGIPTGSMSRFTWSISSKG